MKLRDIVARLRSERQPVRFIVSRLLWRSRLCRLLTIQRNGYRLRFYPTSLSAALWTDAAERALDEAVLEELLHKGDTFVDVGANIGSLARSRPQRGSRVEGFMPSSPTL